jgi:hypothetical protein
VAEKRKARALWHRTHAQADKNKFNKLNRRLKERLKEIRNQSFEEYVSKLTPYDNSIWKPIRNLKQPKHNAENNAEPWAMSDKEKADQFATVYNPLHNDFDPQINHHIALPFSNQHPLTLTTPREILGEITKSKESSRRRPHNTKNAQSITTKRLSSSNLHLQRNAPHRLLAETFQNHEHNNDW